jgi:hypothetical protein
MELEQHVVRRLAFIRYLYQTGVEQSRAPAPLKCASLLTMHDAVELWLQLASERLNAGANQPNFMDYWDLLDRRLAPKELSQKESMRRLNKARVALKHHGTFPSDLDIEAFRSSTRSFFLDNTPLVFGVALEAVSLIEYVGAEPARRLLAQAQERSSKGDVLAALDDVAVAYAEMIRDYEDRKRSRYGTSPFFFGKSLAFHSAFFMGLNRTGIREFDKLGDFVDSVKESLASMQEAIKMIALGIDYRRYSKFKLLTPRVYRTVNGAWHVSRGNGGAGYQATAEDVTFCLDFVIESALALTEFDYSVGQTVEIAPGGAVVADRPASEGSTEPKGSSS